MSDLSFDKLIELVLRGVIHKPPNKKPPKKGQYPIEGAFNNGMYQGAPGKDIYLSLDRLSDDEMAKLAIAFSSIFPKEAPSDHVGYAACIRYVYGQFEKQGILRSKNDHKRMLQETKGMDRVRKDWENPRYFLGLVTKILGQQENYYGLSIISEMEGHRCGDEAVLYSELDGSPDSDACIAEMERRYLKSVEYAHQCNSYKQMFTPYYWMSMYYVKLKNKEKIVEYAIKTVEEAEKHCPDSRGSYVDKIKDALKALKKVDKATFRSKMKAWKKNFKNPCTVKAVKTF